MKTIANYIKETKKVDPKVVAKDIVNQYYGGYMPKSLDDEGDKCENDEALYNLISKMELYYTSSDNAHKIEFSEDSIDDIHKEVTEIVKKLNK